MFILARFLFLLIFFCIGLYVFIRYWPTHIRPWIFEEKINNNNLAFEEKMTSKVQKASLEKIEEGIENEIINKKRKRRKK